MKNRTNTSRRRVTRKLVIATLKLARDIIQEPAKWQKGSMAGQRHPDGSITPVQLGDKNANCFCAAGAVGRAIDLVGVTDEDKLRKPVFDFLIAALPQKKGFDSVIRFNDTPATTHRQVMNLFDRAIHTACLSCTRP